VIGLIMTIYAGGFWSLLLSTFFVGFGNGTVEAASMHFLVYSTEL